MGNEEADKLAKQATCIQPSSNYTSFAFLGIQINKVMKSEYSLFLETNKKSKSLSSYASRYLYKVSKKILLPSGINRETASSFFQLKLGHGYLKAYLHKLGIAQNKHYICGSIKTTRHLLLDYKEYRRQRLTLLQNIRKETSRRKLTLGFLLHTKISIKHTLIFLKETNICTRKWHLKRSDRVEEENEEEN